MAELADAQDLESCPLTGVGVQVSLAAFRNTGVEIIAGVAQLAERHVANVKAGGSNPLARSIFYRQP